MARQQTATDLPAHADMIVLGGGTSGSVVAGILAERTDQTVLVLEAGPDPGALADGGWPADLLDARTLGSSHDWGYGSGATYPDRVVPFERAAVIGGCSSHNGCAAIWGHRRDYDAWAERGNDGWSTDELLPLFHRANERMRVRRYATEEVTPFHQLVLDAAPGAGINLTDDLNDLDEATGIAASPVNIVDGVRWNTGFAYLDPVRDRTNLVIRGGVTVDRLVIEHGRVVAVEVVGPKGRARISCGGVVVSGGTYGSPAILLRSGIGDAAELADVGISPVANLPGVGKNLHDHSQVTLSYAGSRALVGRFERHAATRWTPEEQTIAKVRSRHCADAFDLHIYPVGGPAKSAPGGYRWDFPIAVMTPQSRGSLILASADPTIAPRIAHDYCTDLEGHDVAVLADGVRIGRELATQAAWGAMLGEEIGPGAVARTGVEITAFIRNTCAHYYHPVGTCAMGPTGDGRAVVDPRGKVHGLENAWVADCSIIPVIPRANTNIPAVVIGERIGGWLAERK